MSYVASLEVMDQERIRIVCRNNPQKVLDTIFMLANMEADLKDQLATMPLGTQEGDARASDIQGRIFGLNCAYHAFVDNLKQEEKSDDDASQ
jgi:hypothetical protein